MPYRSARAGGIRDKRDALGEPASRATGLTERRGRLRQQPDVLTAGLADGAEDDPFHVLPCLPQ